MKVKAINELNSDGKKFQSFVVEIDGVMVNVKVYRRLKNAKETGGKECGKGCPLCTSGTWTVMKFSDPEIKKRSDYKKVWRECFFALELNYNPRDSLCKHGNVELQRDKPCKKCKE